MGAPGPRGGVLTLLRRLLLALALGLGLIAVAAGAGLVWLDTDAGGRWVARQLEPQLASLLQTGQVELGSVRVGARRLVIEDLRVHGAEHRDVLVVPRTEARIAWRSLLSRHVELGDVILERPTITLHRTADGYDLPTFPPSTEPAGPPTYMPDGWRLDGRLSAGALTLAMPDDDVRVAEGAIDALLEVDRDELVLSYGTLGATVEQPALGPMTGGLAVILRSADLEMKATVDAEGAAAVVEGTVVDALGAQPVVDAKLDGAVARTTWERWGGVLQVSLPDVDLSAVALRAEVRGAAATPRIGASLFFPDDAAVPIEGEPVATSRIDLLATQSVDVRFTASVPRASAWQPVGAPVEGGSLTASGRVDGADWDHARVTATVTGQRLVLPGVRVGAITAEARYVVARGRLDATLDSDTVDLVLDGGELPLSGTAEVVYEGDGLTVGLSVVDRGQPDRAVRADVAVDLDAETVTARTLVIEADADTRLEQAEPTVVDWGARSLRADLRGEAGRIVVDGAWASEWPTGSAAVHGIDLAVARELAAPFVAEPLPPVTGHLSAAADGSGGWRLSLVHVTAGDYVDDVSADLDGTWREGAIAASGTITGGADELGQLTARVPVLAPDGPASVQIACGATSAAATLTTRPQLLSVLARTFPSLTPPDLDAEISGELTLSGDPCDPALALRARATRELEGRGVQLHLELDDGPRHDAHVVLGAMLDGQLRAVAEGTVEHVPPLDLIDQGLDGLGAFVVDLGIDDLPSEIAYAELPGVLAGDLHVAGEGIAITGAEGRVGFVPGAGTAAPQANLVVITAEGALDATLRTGAVDEEVAPTLHARVALDELQTQGLDAPLQAEVRDLTMTIAELAALSGVDVRKAAGRVAVDGTVGGTLGAPDPDLRVEVTEGGASLPSIGVRYDDVEIVAAVKGERLTVLEGTLHSRPRSRTLRRVGRGMTVSGTVELDDEREVRPDLTVVLDHSWLLAARDTTLQASGEVHVTRPADAYLVKGAVRVDEGRVIVDRSAFAAGGPSTLDPDIVFEDLPPPMLLSRPPDPSTSVMSLFDIDLQVDLGEGVHVEATVPLLEEAAAVGQALDVAVDAELEGSLHVLQDHGDLDLRGRLSPTGRVELLTARFDIEDGSVAFAGGDLLEPALDLKLRRDEGAWGTVRARVHGTPTALELSDLTSDSYADQRDIVAILLFGRPLSEVDTGGSGAGVVAVERALLSVAGRQVEQVLGGSVVDTVNYSTDEGLSLGWNLGGSGFLTVSLDPLADPDENTATAKLTWLLSRRLEAGVESGDTGTASGWIVWRRRF